MSTIQPKVGEPVIDELALVQAAKGGDVRPLRNWSGGTTGTYFALRSTSRRTAKTRKTWCRTRSSRPTAT